MDFGGQTLEVLLALLPGFVAVAITRELTVAEKMTLFERVIQAVIYTFIIHVVWQLPSLIIFGGSLSASANLLGLGVCSIVLGLVMTCIINVGAVHWLLRWTKITQASSQPSAWYAAFYRSVKHYVVLHLKDGRRIFGWPRDYPNLQGDGHVLLEDAQWQSDGPVISSILIDSSDVQFVEFVPMETTMNAEHGDKNVSRKN